MTDHTLTVVHPAGAEHGAVASLASTDSRVVAAGGTGPFPLVLLSSTGRSFVAGNSPADGLCRVAVLPGQVAVCGERGTLAVTADIDALAGAGGVWSTVDTGTDERLSGLAAAPDGSLWVTGENGYCARVRAEAAGWRIERVDLGVTSTVHWAATVGTRTYFGLDDGRLAVHDGATREVDHLGTGTDRPTTGLAVTSSGAVVVCGTDGFLARSVDGRTFTPVVSGTPLSLEGVAVLAGGDVVVVGARGRVLVSDDDGVTFTTVHSGTDADLWTVAPLGTGCLIGGDTGLVVRFGPPGDDGWADRVDVFAGARVLDAAFAGGPDTFLDNGLAAYLAAVATPAPDPGSADDDNDADDFDDDAESPGARAERLLSTPSTAEDFAAVWGVPMPADYHRFVTATAGVSQWGTFHEFEPQPDLIPNVPDENLFELVVLRAQRSYLDSVLPDTFSGMVCMGSQGNGDSYHLEVFETQRDGVPVGHRVIHLDHEQQEFSVFADGVASQVYLSALFQAHDRGLISDGGYQAGLRSLAGRVDPTWHFRIPDNFTRPARHITRPELYDRRSGWIQLLLKNDDIDTVDDVDEHFDEELNTPVTPDLLARWLDECRVLVPAALYVMWRAYFFEEDHLDEVLRVCAEAPARLTRDSARLITELRSGVRTGLGTIEDMAALVDLVRDKDLDPARAEEREREQDEAADREAERAARIDAELSTMDGRWADAAWAHVDDPLYLRRLLAAMAADATRADLLDRIRAATAIEDDEQRGDAMALLAPQVDSAVEAVLTGALLAGWMPVQDQDDEQDDEPDGEPGAWILWHTGGDILLARARTGSTDPRLVPALRPLLTVPERYHHRRTLAIELLTALRDRESLPAVLDVIQANPIGDYIDGMGKHEVLTAAAGFVAEVPAVEAIPALSTLVAPGNDDYDKVRPAAGFALAACLAEIPPPRRLDAETVTEDLLAGFTSAVVGWEHIEDPQNLLAYAMIGRLVEPADRARLLAELPDQEGSLTVVCLARAAAAHLLGGPAGDLRVDLAAALTGREYEGKATAALHRSALRIGGLLPDLVDPDDVVPLTRSGVAAIRAAAHGLLDRLGRPVPPVAFYDADSAGALTDEALLAALDEPHRLGLPALIAEAGRRDLTAAWPAVIAHVEAVARVTVMETQMREGGVLAAGVSVLRAGPLTESVIALFDLLLRHQSYNVKWQLMRDLPDDPRLTPGVQHVAGERWGWQGETALDWLARMSVPTHGQS